MKKKLKWVGLIVLLIVVILGVAFTVLIKKSEENFKVLMATSVQELDLTALSDGFYTGAYNVFPIDVIVTVEVSAQKIVDITIDKHVNGQGKPAEVIIDSVISEQSLDVDMISGATYSSKVIIKAIEKALVN
jgi:uncharacterized protein with FMN-binding domain